MLKIFRIFRWLYKKLRLRRLRIGLPFGILALYTIIGASIFRYCELESDELRRKNYRKSTEYAFTQVLNRMMEVRCEDKLLKDDQQLQARHTKDALFWLIDYLNLTQVIEERSELSPWTWPGSMFYAGQLYTTIGYGLPVARTSMGRLASIIYIMIGIPIFLIILSEVGKLLSRALRKFYKKMRSAHKVLPEDVTRRMSEPVKAFYSLTPSKLLNSPASNNQPSINPITTTTTKTTTTKKNYDIETDQKNLLLNSSTNLQPQTKIIIEQNNNPNPNPNPINDKDNKHSNKSKSFPIPLALTILILWIAFSAAMFCLWETEWGFFTSVYFFFVSISTVGLGDIVPSKPDMMFINFILILIGLALLSMCVNLIQEALERLIEQLIDEYIVEIEKIAAVVNNQDEFEEETSTPFEVGMTAEMLTVPVTTIAKTNEIKNGSIVRSVKDWMAEKIANNLLMNRLDPHHSMDSSSSDSESNESNDLEDEDEDIEAIIGLPNQLYAKASIVGDLTKEIDEAILPTILFNKEDIPLTNIQNNSKKLRVKDNKSTSSSEQRHKNSLKRHQYMLAKTRLGIPFPNYNHSTMRAIQTIQAAKMRTYRNTNFKSRLFAKFATNERWNRLAANESLTTPIQNNKMVNSSIQTDSPVIIQSTANLRNIFAGQHSPNCVIESMDSTSSDIGMLSDYTNNSIFDIDSLCSTAYYDLSFQGYSTDSVPKLMANSNTPQNGGQNSNFNNVIEYDRLLETVNNGRNLMSLPFPIARPKKENGFTSTPTSPKQLRHLLIKNHQQPSTTPLIKLSQTTPVIQLTDVDADASFSSSSGISSPISVVNFQDRKRSISNPDSIIQMSTTKQTPSTIHCLKPLNQFMGNSNNIPAPPPPTSSSSFLLNKRRFSTNNSLPLPDNTHPNLLGMSMGSETSQIQLSFLQLRRPPMSRCPSCHHFSTIPTTSSSSSSSSSLKKKPIDAKTIDRIRQACGLLPVDFSPSLLESINNNKSQPTTTKTTIKVNQQQQQKQQELTSIDSLANTSLRPLTTKTTININNRDEDPEILKIMDNLLNIVMKNF